LLPLLDNPPVVRIAQPPANWLLSEQRHLRAYQAAAASLLGKDYATLTLKCKMAKDIQDPSYGRVVEVLYKPCIAHGGFERKSVHLANSLDGR
jgi:hypothetical protein